MKKVYLTTLTFVLLLSAAFTAKAQLVGYEGRRLTLKADFQSYHRGLMPGIQLEYMHTPTFATAFSINRRSISSSLDGSEDYSNRSALGADYQISTLHPSVLLKFYRGDEIMSAQSGRYSVVQFGVNLIQATTPADIEILDDFGYVESTVRDGTRTFKSKGLMLGYGIGYQKIVSRRILLDVSYVYFASVDQGFENSDSRLANQVGLIARKKLYNPLIDELSEQFTQVKVGFGMRVALRVGFLL